MKSTFVNSIKDNNLFFYIQMNDNIKTQGLSNSESYVLKYARFNTFLIVLFTDENKAQNHKMPYRNSPHHEIEILMSFDYLHLLRPNEHTEDYYKRKPNIEFSFFKIEDKRYIHAGKILFSSETNDENVKYSSEHGYNDNKYPYAYGEGNIYFMLHQKYIPLQEYGNSTMKNEYQYLDKKDEELKGDNITVENEGVVEYGNDFSNCKIIHSKQ